MILLVVGLCVAVPARYMYKRNQAQLLAQTQQKALNMAVAIAAFLSYDIEHYRPISEVDALQPGSELEQAYLTFNSVLQTIKAQSDATFIYTSKYRNERISSFVLDAEDPKSVLFSPLGSYNTMDEYELKTYRTATATVTPMMADSVWGTYLTAYAPIIDTRDQTVAGVAGVDYSQDFLKQQYVRINWVITTTFAIFSLILTLALYIMIITIQSKHGMDDLTKLGSKRTFLKILGNTLEEAKKRNQNFVLCVLDVDDFKTINDTYGHPVGDMVLKYFGKALLNAVDQSKLCFRYGGDEFAVILPDTTLLQAETTKLSMQKEIENIDISCLKGKKLSASIGMAEWFPGITAETLIDLADKNLYVQKQLHKKAGR